MQEIVSVPFCCNPLTVAIGGSKLRLVLDIRHVNQFIAKKTFRYEDLYTLAEMFEQNNYFFTFDLKSGYHHIAMHPASIKYLGFQWTFIDGRQAYFQFSVLPFGLTSAGYIFTEVLRPFVKKWRTHGIKSILYLDDGINGHISKEEAHRASIIIASDLNQSGFLLNTEKSHLEPSQTGRWLGVLIDTTSMTFTVVPPEKAERLRQQLQTALAKPYASANSLASIAGTLSSMHLGVGPLTRLQTRAIYADIANTRSWYSPVTLSPETVAELNFWLTNYNFTTGYSFKPQQVTSKSLFTDASDEGYGGYMVNKVGKAIAVGKFVVLFLFVL